MEPSAPEASSQIEQGSQTPFVVFIGGHEPKGRPIAHIRNYLTEAFGEDNVYFPTPISRRAVVHDTPKSADEYHDGVAEEILQRAKGRNLRIIAQSSGGYEVLPILESCFEKGLQNQDIELTLFAVPGLTMQGVGGAIETAKRLYRIKSSMAFVEQHIVYPLPESFYESKSVSFDTDDKRFEFVRDTPEARKIRQEQFLETAPKVIPDEEKRALFLKSVDVTDQKVEEVLGNPHLSSQERDEQLQALVRERAQVMQLFTDAFFKGDFVPDEMVAHYAKLYNEFVLEKVTPLQMMRYAFPFFGTAIRQMVNGYYERLQETVNRARGNNVNMRFSVAVSEHDPLIKMGELSAIGKRFDTSGLELAQVIAFEQFGHTSIAHDPTQLTYLGSTNLK